MTTRTDYRPRVAQCPRCKSTNLTLFETHAEQGASDGPIVVTPDGGYAITRDFDFEPGDPLRVVLRCQDCNHEWSRPATSVRGAWTCPVGHWMVDGEHQPTATCPTCGHVVTPPNRQS